MRKINQWMLIVAAVIAFLSSCKEEEMPKGAFESGVLIVNEGNYNDADGSISFYDPSTGSVENNIFSKNNSGQVLGDVVQSIKVNGDIAYIVVNNSNKVEVVNAHTMEQITSIDADLPRYMAIANGNGYITEWGANFASPMVRVIDLEQNSLKSEIAVESGADEIVQAQGKLYVANSWSNTISVIDPNLDQVSATITTDFWGISGLVVDAGGAVWGVYEGSTDWAANPPVANNDGALVKIDMASNTVATVVYLNSNVSDKLAMDNLGQTIYLLSGQSVFAYNTSASTMEELINEPNAVSFYGIGVSPTSGEIYVADAKGFQGNGEVFVYSPSGTKITSFGVGRGPNGFVFK